MLSLVLIVAAVLIVVIVAMIFRIGSLVSTVKQPTLSRVGTSNRINAAMWLGFLIFGTIAAVWSYMVARQDFLPESSSSQGKEVDYLFWVTMTILVIVFLVTHVLLFYFP